MVVIVQIGATIRFIGKSEFLEFELCEIAVEHVFSDCFFQIWGVDDFVVWRDGHLVFFEDSSVEFVKAYPVVGIHFLGIVASFPRSEVVSGYELRFLYACQTAFSTPFIEDEGAVQFLASEFVYCYPYRCTTCPRNNTGIEELGLAGICRAIFLIVLLVDFVAFSEGVNQIFGPKLVPYDWKIDRSMAQSSSPAAFKGRIATFDIIHLGGYGTSATSDGIGKCDSLYVMFSERFPVLEVESECQEGLIIAPLLTNCHA